MPSMIVNFLNIGRYLKIFEFSFVKLLTSSKLNRNCFMKNETHPKYRDGKQSTEFCWDKHPKIPVFE